jgi:hypothetical protein
MNKKMAGFSEPAASLDLKNLVTPVPGSDKTTAFWA